MDEDWYSFKRGTLVAGSFTKDEFQGEIDRVNQLVGGYIDSYFNAKIANYKLHARGFESNRLIELEEVFADDYKRLEPDWSDRKVIQYQQYHVGHRFAFLFPFHKLAFVLYSYGFNQLDGVREKLGQLGYRVIEKRDKTEKGKPLDSIQWNDENYREVLRELRTREHLQEVGIDRRIVGIVEKVHAMIDADSYQFGIFIPKFWGSRKPKHRYDTITKGLVVSPVKELIEVHGQWVSSSLEGLVEGLDLTKAIGLTSKIQTKDKVRHIPMIDFEDALKSNKWNYGFEAQLSDALDKVNMKGFLVSSGNSYHFYGNRLLKENEWRIFMEMLKEVPFVDEKWPDLQLMQGYSMLRITPSIRKFTQPCYLKDYFPQGTGTDFNSLGNTNELQEKISVAA